LVWSNVGCQLNYSMERRSDAVKLGNMPGYWVQTVKFLPFKAKLDQVANPEFTVYIQMNNLSDKPHSEYAKQKLI